MNDEMTTETRPNIPDSPVEKPINNLTPNSNIGDGSDLSSATNPPQKDALPKVNEAPSKPVSSTPLGFDAISPVAESAESKISALKDGFLNFALPILALSASVALILLVIVPLRRDLPALEADLTAKKALAGRLAHKVDVLHQLSNSHDTLSAYLNVVESALTSEPLVPELLAQVDTMARSSGMLVSGLNYSHGSSPDSDSLGYVTVALTSVGTFDNLVSFMHTVEDARRLVFVDDFRYSSVYTDGVSQVSASFQLKSPYKEVQSDAVTDSPIDLDITSARFLQDIARIKALHLYDYVPAQEVAPAVDQPTATPGFGGANTHVIPESSLAQ